MEAGWNIPITDPSQVGEARRIATALATTLSFNETEAGRVALVVTEIGHNIHKHAGQGEILIRSVHDGLGIGLEILGIDRGPGMANINLCMEDGYSTAGTTGLGLGGIRRLSASFALDSHTEKGTCVLARVYQGQAPKPRLPLVGFEWASIHVPHPQERISGDAYFVQESINSCTAMVVDGLGHGPLAADAAYKAYRVMQECGHEPLEDLIQSLHRGLRGTRGAALGIARILPGENELRFIGIGNISGSMIQADGSSKSVMSYPGIVGHEMRRPREIIYPWNEQTTLVLHSDGLQSQWLASDYPLALASEPSLLASVLYRDFNRGRDDVTILTIKWRPPRSPGP